MFSADLNEDNLVVHILDSQPNMVFIISQDGEIRFINKSVKTLFAEDGIRSEMKILYDVCSEYEIICCNNNFTILNDHTIFKIIASDYEFKDRIIQIKRNDKMRYISISKSIIKNGDSHEGFLLSAQDVTATYLADLQIKEERKKFISISTELKTKCDIIEILRNREKEHLMNLKDVINNISEGLIVFDNKGNFNFCNKIAYSILNIKYVEILNFPKILVENYNIYCNSKEVDLAKEFFNIEEDKNQVYLFSHKETKEEKYIEFNISLIKNKNKEFLYTIITFRDVTDIKRHEILAEQSANFTRNVIDTMDIPMVVIKYPEMRIMLVNKKFEYIVRCLTGENVHEYDLMNSKITDVFEKGKGFKLLRWLNYCIKIDKEFTTPAFELCESCNDNTFYKFKYKPYKDSNGNLNLIHLQAIDITDETKHNMELEKVTRLKDEFFTIISHELRTPLTIIYSSLQLAYDIYGKEITPNLHKTLSRINLNCSRLLKLINNILDISKAEAGFLLMSPSDFDIVYETEFIVSTVNTYARSKNIELIFDTNEEEMEVNMDKDMYEKILMNLLSNAIKYTPEGRGILVELEVDNNYVELSVKDEGVGIPEDKLDSIFDRFAQVNSSLSRRAEGTGLGLSLVKKFVEIMGGKITVNSILDVGSEFKIHFDNKPVKSTCLENHSMINANMNDKIHIEFSDIN